MIAGKLAGYQVGRNIVADANIQIDPFISQIYQPVGDVEADLQLRVATGQLGERRRDHPPTKAKAADDPQRSLRHLPHIGELIHHLVDILQNALPPFVDALALFGDSHSPGSAVQQLDVKGLLQQRYAFADKCRRDAELFRSGGKTGAAGYQHKDA